MIFVVIGIIRENCILKAFIDINFQIFSARKCYNISISHYFLNFVLIDEFSQGKYIFSNESHCYFEFLSWIASFNNQFNIDNFLYILFFDKIFKINIWNFEWLTVIGENGLTIGWWGAEIIYARSSFLTYSKAYFYPIKKRF